MAFFVSVRSRGYFDKGHFGLEHLLHGWFPEHWARELLLKQVHHGLFCREGRCTRSYHL